MSRVYTSKKSPFIAGFLSVIPGMGQIYNEQSGKGLLIFFLFLASFAFFVLRISPLSMIPNLNIQPFDSIAHFENTPIRMVWVAPWGNPALSRIYPLLWFMVMLPFFIVFSISDAVQNARRINLSFAQPAAASSPPPPPPSNQMGDSSAEQDRLRNEAQQKMGEPAANGTYQPSKEETMNSQNTANPQNPNPEAPPKTPSRGISGKFLLGIVLMAVGGVYILDGLHIHVFHWVTWDNLWPLIPLFFGLRLLREYQFERDRGQFVLGTCFTAAGIIFSLQNWDIFPAMEIIKDFWMFILFGLGALFVLMDILERRRVG